jgi:hypothetical protein
MNTLDNLAHGGYVEFERQGYVPANRRAKGLEIRNLMAATPCTLRVGIGKRCGAAAVELSHDYVAGTIETRCAEHATPSRAAETTLTGRREAMRASAVTIEKLNARRESLRRRSR